jgi:hypothetical protein
LKESNKDIIGDRNLVEKEDLSRYNNTSVQDIKIKKRNKMLRLLYVLCIINNVGL